MGWFTHYNWKARDNAEAEIARLTTALAQKEAGE